MGNMSYMCHAYLFSANMLFTVRPSFLSTCLLICLCFHLLISLLIPSTSHSHRHHRLHFLPLALHLFSLLNHRMVQYTTKKQLFLCAHSATLLVIDGTSLSSKSSCPAWTWGGGIHFICIHHLFPVVSISIVHVLLLCFDLRCEIDLKAFLPPLLPTSTPTMELHPFYCAALEGSD